MTRRAVTPGDLAHARLPGFNRRVAASIRTIEEAASIGRTGVSYSGGKDSTVLLSLVRQVVPSAPAAFYDSGCEYPEVYELVEHYDVQTIKPQRSLLEMCRYGGYWGYGGDDLVDKDAEFAFFEFLIGEPSARFVHEQALAVMAMGLRAEESAGRRMSAYKRGELYQVKSGLWHFCPLAKWTHNDIWAFIASRHLRYNAVYDRMAALGIPRERWRISALLGLCGAATLGRYAYLRQIDPALFRRLAAEFPKIANYT